MNIVQILYSGLGGHGSVVFSLDSASKAARAWTSRLIFLGIEPVLADYALKCRSEGTAFGYVRTRQGRAWMAWPAVYRELRRARPDAIVLHSVKAIVPCAIYARRHGVPILAVEHQPNALKSYAEHWVSRRVMRLADGVVVLTPEYRSQLRTALGKDWIEDKVHLISNGINITTFQPTERNPRSARPCTVGMAARMTGTKRQELLIAAIALLCEQDGRHAWRLSLAGEGDSLSELRARALSLGLDDVVSFPGYLGEAALQAWFGSLDFYAHASSGETLSTSLLQALAMGLPVVGSDVAGIKDLLASGGGVGLAVAQTPEAFANAIRQLADDADLAAGLGRRARALVVAEYGHHTMFQKYQCILDRLCAG